MGLRSIMAMRTADRNRVCRCHAMFLVTNGTRRTFRDNVTPFRYSHRLEMNGFYGHKPELTQDSSIKKLISRGQIEFESRHVCV